MDEMTSALDTEITGSLPLLATKEKEALLDVMRCFVALKEEYATGVDKNAYNLEIDAAMARMDSGQFTTHEDVEREMDGY